RRGAGGGAEATRRAERGGHGGQHGRGHPSFTRRGRKRQARGGGEGTASATREKGLNPTQGEMSAGTEKISKISLGHAQTNRLLPGGRRGELAPRRAQVPGRAAERASAQATRKTVCNISFILFILGRLPPRPRLVLPIRVMAPVPGVPQCVEQA